jgi:hypothetical protein
VLGIAYQCPIGLIRCDDLLRIMAEGVHIQRHAVVESANPSPDSCVTTCRWDSIQIPFEVQNVSLP